MRGADIAWCCATQAAIEDGGPRSVLQVVVVTALDKEREEAEEAMRRAEKERLEMEEADLIMEKERSEVCFRWRRRWAAED